MKTGNMTRRRPFGILGVRFGYNPNSSSLGVNLTALIWGSLMIGLLSPLIGSVVRLVRLRGKVDIVNPPPSEG